MFQIKKIVFKEIKAGPDIAQTSESKLESCANSFQKMW